MNKILVVYYYLSKYGHGYGNTLVSHNSKTLSMDIVREIEQKIREDCFYDAVVIVNIINLESEDSDE